MDATAGACATKETAYRAFLAEAAGNSAERLEAKSAADHAVEWC